MHINDLLGITVAKDASDLHLKAGSSPVLRINGELVRQEQIPEMIAEDMKKLFEELTIEEQRSSFAREMESDFAHQANGIGM